MLESQLNETLESSVVEIVAELLGVDVQHLADESSQRAGDCGSQLAVKIEGTLHEVGIVSTNENAQKISRTMLCMEEDEALSEEEVVDAIGELVNMVVGRVKGKLSTDGVSVALCTPVPLDLESMPNEQLAFGSPEFEFSAFLKTNNCCEESCCV